MKNVCAFVLLFAAWHVPAIAAPIVADGLVAYYPFDGNANDASGNNHNGTVVGGVTFAGGVLGEAARFDGSSGFVRVADTAVGNLGTNATLAFWFNADASNFASGQHRLFEKDNGAYWSFAAGTSGLGVNLRGSNSLGPPEAQFILADTQALTQHWTAIALRKNGSTFDLFVNGQSAGTRTANIPGIATTAPMNFGDSFFWGQRGDPQWFAGSIDEARIYDRALGNAEIAQLASIAPAVPEPPAALLLFPGLLLVLRRSRQRRIESHGGLANPLRE